MSYCIGCDDFTIILFAYTKKKITKTTGTQTVDAASNPPTSGQHMAPRTTSLAIIKTPQSQHITSTNHKGISYIVKKWLWSGL